METLMDAVLTRYCYVEVETKWLIGYSESPNVKTAGEINPQGCDWYTSETPVENAPLGDVFVRSETEFSRYELLEEQKEEAYSARLKAEYEARKRV